MGQTAGESDLPRFLCPRCGGGLGNVFHPGERRCAACAFRVEAVDGIPLLVADRQRVERWIEEARSAGRAPWYDRPQAEQWTGPYRHHLAKRRRYVEGVLAARAACRRIRTALDLGCGDGMHYRWLARFAGVTYGSDYNLSRLRRAVRLPGAAGRIFLADICRYPVADAGFDLVFFNHVLEHIPDDQQALAEVHRILRPGGMLILGVPNEGAVFWQLAFRLQPRLRATSDHVHFYTAAAIRDKCEGAGFRVQEVHAIGWGPPHWGLDALVRRWKWVDDLFEKVGRRLCPSQATSLYLVCEK